MYVCMYTVNMYIYMYVYTYDQPIVGCNYIIYICLALKRNPLLVDRIQHEQKH